MSAWLEELQQALGRGERDAVGNFWQAVDASGAPLVEMLSGDVEHVLVTFLWRGDSQTQNVLVLGGWHGYHAAGNQLQRLGDTDIWYRSYRVREGTRATYHLLPNDDSTDTGWWLRQRAARLDPRNSRTLTIPADDEDPDDRDVVLSVFALPNAPADAWAREAPRTSACWSTTFRSALLGNRRRITVYTPPDYDAAGVPCGLLVVFDGIFFHRALRTDALLDALIGSGRVPPTVAVFVDHPDPSSRDRELHGSFLFADFLAEELVPWLRERYTIHRTPERTTIAGASHGGLAAAFTALARPDVFGNVVAMSGAFEWHPEGEDEHEWLSRRLASMDRCDLRWWVSVGLRETWLGPEGGPDRVLANRHLRTVLRARGYPVEYREMPTGHDYLFWRDSLAQALETLWCGRRMIGE